MHKLYVRPKLYFGIENSIMNKSELNLIEREVGKLIKKILGLLPRLRTKKLLRALKITPTLEYINSIKMSYFVRLMEKEFTSNLIEKLTLINSIASNSFIMEIAEITKQNNIIDMLDSCLVAPHQLKTRENQISRDPSNMRLKKLLDELPKTLLEVTNELKAFGNPVGIIMNQ